MATETILSVLSKQNPPLKPWCIGPGPNTVVMQTPEFEHWEPWPDFNAKTLRAIYKDVVQAPWRGAPAEVDVSDFDATYGDEDGFEQQVLSRTTIPMVNAALRHAKELCNHQTLLHLGRKGRCQYGEDARINPDWTLVNNVNFTSDGKFESIMTGDSKLSAKWQPGLYQTDDDQWRRPISQVLMYSNQVQCRYGFLITDNELVAFQFARESVGPGIATTRGVRTAQTTHTHQRVASGVSQLSGSVQAMSISGGSAGAQSYSETGRGFDYQNPKYQIIPWTNAGNGDLTVKSSLFYLCMMAGYGSSHVDTGYPELNTWWYLPDGAFRHNTSGFTAKRLGSKDRIQDPNPDPQQGGGAEQVMDDMEHNMEGSSYLEREYLGEDTGQQYSAQVYPEVGGSESAYPDTTYPVEAGPSEREEFGELDEEHNEEEEEEEEEDEEQEELMQSEKGKRKAKKEAGRSKRRGNEGKSESSLPTLSSKSSDHIVKVNFSLHKGVYCFKNRSGDMVPVKKREWSRMEYKGRPVLVYKGRKTMYIADKLPS